MSEQHLDGGSEVENIPGLVLCDRCGAWHAFTRACECLFRALGKAL